MVFKDCIKNKRVRVKKELTLTTMDYTYCINALQEYAEAPESAGVDNEFFINVVKVMKELEEENKKLKQVVDNETAHNRMLERKNKELKEENKELKQQTLFLRAECYGGGWNGRDNDVNQFADDVLSYFKEYKQSDNIENVEELYKEWKEWACIEDQVEE